MRLVREAGQLLTAISTAMLATSSWRFPASAAFSFGAGRTIARRRRPIRTPPSSYHGPSCPRLSSASSAAAAAASSESGGVNLLQGSPPLNNSFFALRHGQSEANCLGIIASDPKIACHKYGLSETGQKQAQQAGEAIVQEYISSNNNNYDGLAVISSDLLRCQETADIVVEAVRKTAHSNKIPLHTNAIIFDKRLRERNFGNFDGTSDDNYSKVWKSDAVDSSHTRDQVESVDSVMRRSTEMVTEYDALLRNHLVVLTAHGDVLQILQTAFLKLPGTQHRTVPHLETATLRRLELKE